MGNLNTEIDTFAANITLCHLYAPPYVRAKSPYNIDILSETKVKSKSFMKKNGLNSSSAQIIRKYLSLRPAAAMLRYKRFETAAY
jgi:triphosphoribosyl-dephospho-CoA synthetase